MVTATRAKIEETDNRHQARVWSLRKISSTAARKLASSHDSTRNKVHFRQVRAHWPQVAGACAQWRLRCWLRRSQCCGWLADADQNWERKSSASSVHCNCPCQSERAARRRPGHSGIATPAAAAAAAATRDERRESQSSRIISIESPWSDARAATSATVAHATQPPGGNAGLRDLTDDKIVAPARPGPSNAPFAMPEKDRRKGACHRVLATRMHPESYLLPLFTLFLVTIFASMNYYQVTWAESDTSSAQWPLPPPVAGMRISNINPTRLQQQQHHNHHHHHQHHRHRWPQRRSLFGPAGGGGAGDGSGSESSDAPSGSQGQDIVPYQTYYATQACEWKSNLFVPKSNDIHFAQPQRVVQAPLDQRQQQVPDETSGFEDAGSRTIFTTSNKALILALPPISHTTFAGYEPACSIRLIVPRNMRILAKLTARRLTFEQELLPGEAGQLELAPLGIGPSGGGGGGGGEPTAHVGQLWLNVSQNQFSETEQRTIETESNVLAFRFLLERFASLREPDIRLQVVLTAFQTWGENSDTGLAVGQPPTQSGDQLICDSGRLISANLACDGFRNCLDGQDEEPASCAALRQQQQAAATPTPHLSSFNQTKAATSQPEGAPNSWAPVRVLNWITRDASPAVALLAALLLLLLLLFCCTCCCYCLMLLARRAIATQDDSGASRRRLRRRLAALKMLNANAIDDVGSGRANQDEGLETDSLARGQNLENAARLKARGLLEGSQRAASTSQQLRPLVDGQVRHIQSILKRPATTASGQPTASFSHKGVAPLARFESIPALGDPPPPPPRGSAANRKLIADPQQKQQHQRPSPRRGALADSMTSARSSGRSFPDFRPTPATRGKREPPAGILRSQPQQQRQTPPISYPSTSGTPHPGAQQVGVPQPAQITSSRDNTGRQQQQQQQALPADTSGSFAYKSRTTKLEQTSTSTGSERVTVYQYSSNLAQYSESYLLREQQQQERRASGSPPGSGLLVTGTRVAPSASANSNDNLNGADKDQDEVRAPELPPKSRQSSLI